MNVEHLIKESKKNARSMGESKNLDFIISTFSVLSDLPENKSQNILYDYLHSKFMRSDFKNFDSFIEKELTTEEGVQIKADIPRSAIPEQQPEKKKKDLEEGFLYYEEEENEEEDSENGSEEKSSPSGEEESSEASSEKEEINSFLDEIGLSDLDENQAMVYLERFKSLLDDAIEDKEAIDLIIYLLYKAWSDSLSDGETLELKDLMSKFNLEEESEEDSKDEEVKESYSYLFEKEGESDSKKIGVISSIVGATLLFGVGGLLFSGLVAAVSGSSEEDFEKQKKSLELSKMKFELEKNKIEFQNKLKKDAEEQANKNEKNPPGEQTPQNMNPDSITKDGENAKETAITKAKENVSNDQSSSEDKQEPETEPEQDKSKKSDKDQEKEDEKNLDPQEFHKKYDKCPKGWNWDKETNACVQVEKLKKEKPKKKSPSKKESIDYQVLLF